MLARGRNTVDTAITRKHICKHQWYKLIIVCLYSIDFCYLFRL